MSDCHLAGNVRGVDSTATSKDALPAAKALAEQHKCIVAVSGAVDFVSPLCGDKAQMSSQRGSWEPEHGLACMSAESGFLVVCFVAAPCVMGACKDGVSIISAP